MSVDMRRGDCGVGGGNDVKVYGFGVVAVESGREWILLLIVVGVFPRILLSSAEISRWQSYRSVTHRRGMQRRRT